MALLNWHPGFQLRVSGIKTALTVTSLSPTMHVMGIFCSDKMFYIKTLIYDFSEVIT
ncbi:MAG: hypothetical protein HGA57_05665 [Chlorobium limicola]|uniref:hypothetical protein n=1 Tax=Chlorobium limicola TaxID=1092 RepID=UPI0023F2A9D5|nr:hypothetical protein [Chlorobium limicola]NTV20860.1 hypothetical protein [Chlorobium limicola]